uniref:TonB-dependent transporter Oar-like beta-barrel domain-containing protein n=1 Tax=mine drainage metagenome TaxID=410659 RepID=E6QIR2_9ZZZZ
MFHRFAWVVLFFAATAFSAHAQFTGTAQGTVTDSSGAVVNGANVTLTLIDTNEAQTFVTQKSGQYTFNSLAPGLYRVSVEAPGFKKAVIEQRITTEQTAGINVVLTVGSATAETINVSDDNGHGLNPDETRLQYTLSAREIAEYPLQNRATLGLLSTAPGATGIAEAQSNINSNTVTPAQSTNGRSNESNLYLFDFIPLNTEMGGYSDTNGTGHGPGSIPIIPTPDMLQEIALDSTTFSVENGFSSGLQVSMTTKSGSNKFHGDADYTYTGEPYAAIAPFETTQTPFRRQYVSGALGGPIWRDRTFFFGSYFNQNTATSGGGLSYFPAPEFISWAQTNYPKSMGINDGFAPNPASRATNIRTTQLGSDSGLLAPRPVDPGPACGTTGGPYPALPCDLPVQDEGAFAAPSTQSGAEYDFRIDHTMREGKDRLYASFLRFDQFANAAKIIPTLDGQLPSTGYYLAGNYTHQFTPSLLNQLSVGQTRTVFSFGPTPHSESQLLLPFQFGCFCSAQMNTVFEFTYAGHQTYARDAVSWVKGQHNMNFGFQLSYNNETSDNSIVYARPFLQSNIGIYDFLRDITNFELIYTLSAQNGKFIPQFFGAQTTRLGAYAQDSWKVTSNLVLNYGLRWDDYGNPTVYGTNAEPFSNVILGPGSTLQQQVAGAGSFSVKNPYSSARWANFNPRGSFAYTLPKSRHNLVAHGGIGLYEDDLNLNQLVNNIPTQPPTRLSLTLMNNAWGGANTAIQPVTSFGTTTVQGPPGGNPYGFQFPVITINGFNAKGAPLDPNGNPVIGSLNGVYQNLQPQKSLIYNLGFEQEMPAHLVFGLMYSGSHGYDQLVQTDVNTYAGLDSSPNNQRYNTDFSQINLFRNDGVSNYNALIATARQTVGSLTYQASYTWGHALADPTENLVDQQNIGAQYTNANYDIRNRFSLLQVYEVPAHYSSWLMNEALGGWSVSNTVVAQSGSPFTASTTTDYNQDGINYDIPLYLGTKRNFSNSDARKSALTGTSVFGNNATAFTAPPGITEGGRENTFYGPGYFDIDTGVNKKFQLPWLFGEKATLALRAEASNTLNHTNFTNPNAAYNNGGSFGLVTGAYQHRIIQIGSRLQF